jgi:DNA polymerase III delta subunit
LDHSWEDRQIAVQKGTAVQLVSIREFLIQKLNREIVFEEHESASWSSPEETSEIFSILCQFLENPPTQVEFVLSAQIKNTRELNQDIYTLIKQNANQIKKSILYDDSRPVSWVMERAQKKQLKLNAMLAGLLVEIAGSDFNTLNMELEKLSILVSLNEALTPELLLRSVSQSKSFTVFRITDSLTRKDLKDTLDCLGILLGTHVTDSTAIFALIAAQFRKLLKISWLAQQDLPEKLIIDRLGLNPWIAKQLLKQIQNYTTKELENIVIFLAKSDIQLKYSAKDAKTLLENLCFLICQHAFRNVKTIKSNWLP